MTLNRFVPFILCGPLVAGMLVGACASPSTPHVMVLPGDGKSFEQFHADDTTCRQWAGQQPGANASWRYDMGYMQCMYSKGHQIPVVGGTRATYTSQSQAATAPPAATPAAPATGTPAAPAKR